MKLVAYVIATHQKSLHSIIQLCIARWHTFVGSHVFRWQISELHEVQTRSLLQKSTHPITPSNHFLGFFLFAHTNQHLASFSIQHQQQQQNNQVYLQ